MFSRTNKKSITKKQQHASGHELCFIIIIIIISVPILQQNDFLHFTNIFLFPLNHTGWTKISDIQYYAHYTVQNASLSDTIFRNVIIIKMCFWSHSEKSIFT